MDAAFGGVWTQEQESENDPGNPYRHVDGENQRPPGIRHDIAAKRRADRRGHQRRNAQNPGRQAAQLGRKLREKQGNRQRKERGPTDSLHDPKSNQRRQIPGETAECRPQSEQRKRENIEALCPQAIGEEGRCQRDYSLSKV